MVPILKPVPDPLQGAPEWEFALEGELVEWDWGRGAPRIDEMGPVRAVRSGSRSRHAPVMGYCSTVGSVLPLESGLELELMLWLDRQPQVKHIVAQPARLRWGVGSHTVDLLSADSDGRVTLWDARPAERRDPPYKAHAEATAGACAEVGWVYAEFAGLSPTASLNLRWLAGARREPDWLAAHVDAVRDLCNRESTVGDVLEADRGRGYLLSSMWHLAWRGDVHVDLEQLWDERTELSWVGRGL